MHWKPSGVPLAYLAGLVSFCLILMAFHVRDYSHFNTPQPSKNLSVLHPAHLSFASVNSNSNFLSFFEELLSSSITYIVIRTLASYKQFLSGYQWRSNRLSRSAGRSMPSLIYQQRATIHPLRTPKKFLGLLQLLARIKWNCSYFRRFFAKAHTYENGDRWLSVLADCNWESECPRWRIDHVIDIRILNGGNVKYSKMVQSIII